MDVHRGRGEPVQPPEDTAVRELSEETGLLVRARHVIGERVHPLSARIESVREYLTAVLGK